MTLDDFKRLLHFPIAREICLMNSDFCTRTPFATARTLPPSSREHGAWPCESCVGAGGDTVRRTSQSGQEDPRDDAAEVDWLCPAGRSSRERPKRQRVIIRAKAGMRAALRAASAKRGHAFRADHSFINASAIEVDADDLARLAADDRIESVSADAPLQGDQTSVADPLTLMAQRTGRGDGQSAAKTQARLRGTLGLNSTYTGAGVTVALIRLRLEPSPDFTGRIRRSTISRGRAAFSGAVRRIRPRDAHRGAD